MIKPKLRENEILDLYECGGKVYSIKEFVNLHISILKENEQKIIKSYNNLAEDKDIPIFLRRIRTRSRWLAKKRNIIKVNRSGARSAYWKEKGIKFKGCRPIKEGAEFPKETLKFGQDKIIYLKIPFGILTAEEVMRELLAYCFFKINNIKIHLKPICVYRYPLCNQESYSLVLKTESEKRIESYFDYNNYSLADLMTADAIREEIGFKGILGKEISVNNINTTWYADRKSSLLIAMHFNGGFRGLLNSNIGNDVLLYKNGKISKLYICDFDTFKVIDIPKNPSKDFLKSFILHCSIEVFKGSLPIVDYIGLESEKPEAVAEKVAEVYFNTSSLWKAYKRKFDSMIDKLGWDKKIVDAIINEVQSTLAFKTMVLDCVPNFYTLCRSKKIENSMYSLHN